jgi:hypothetical protein
MGSQSSKPAVSSKVEPTTVPSTTAAQEDQPYPQPSGEEYDALDKIAAELPNVIDDESRQQVEDYKQACDSGKGP